MPFLTLLAAAAAGAADCPKMEGIWTKGEGERVMVMEQRGCALSGTVAEPANQLLHVKGFWTGAGWTMAATRLGQCATTAWGSIRAEGDAMLIRVRGSDGLCGADGAPGAGPSRFDATMTYRRVDPDA